MADWEDIVLGGALGIAGGFLLTKRKGDPPVPPIIEDALKRHKERVEAKISNQKSSDVSDGEAGVVGGS